VTVVMMGEMSLDDWDEKKNDKDEVDGMRQEADCNECKTINVVVCGNAVCTCGAEIK